MLIYGKYCGPFNRIGAKPIDRLDRACAKHDKGYAELQRKGVNPYIRFNKYDEDFLSELRKIPASMFSGKGFSKRMAQAFFGGKKILTGEAPPLPSNSPKEIDQRLKADQKSTLKTPRSIFMGKRKRSRSKMRPRKKQKVGSSVRKDGVERTSRQNVGKRVRYKRKKSSLSDKVKRLMKKVGDLPKPCVLKYDKVTPISVKGTGANQKGIFEAEIFGHVDVETIISQLPGTVDLTANNTSVLLKNVYIAVEMVNNSNQDIELSACFVKCTDDATDSWLTNWAEDITDRGLTAPSITGATAASATTAHIPRNAYLSNDGFRFPVFNTRQNRGVKWKNIGKIQKKRLAPGDSFFINLRVGDIMYHPERRDNDAPGYMKNFARSLIFTANGMYSHETVTNVNLVYRECFRLDGEIRLKYDVQYEDDARDGTVDYKYDSGYDSTNFNTAKFITNNSPTLAECAV